MFQVIIIFGRIWLINNLNDIKTKFQPKSLTFQIEKNN